MHCGSTAWSDRKEGLVGLQAWLQAGNTLDPTQLKLITECFTKMFMDSHTKVGITFSQIYLQIITNPLIDFLNGPTMSFSPSITIWVNIF